MPKDSIRSRQRFAWAFVLALCCLAACSTSKERLTGRAMSCATRDVTIVPSGFARRGVETAWCATCGDKLYVCATNHARTRTECHEVSEASQCE